MEIILTHQNADFDAVASMLGAYKLNPDAVPILPSRQESTVHHFLTLYRNGLPFVAWADFQAWEPITHITLTDTHTCPTLADVPAKTPTLIIEHHDLSRKLQSYEIWAGENVGAATTLLVERIRERKIKLTSLEATLLALGIYTDTGMFTFGGTTPRDIHAAAWLFEQGAVLDTVRRFLSNTLNAEQQQLLEVLLESPDNRNIQGYDITVCTATAEKHISGINSVASYLREILDSDALCVVVQLPQHLQLVCRSTDDAIDVGQLAQHFGGGGHPRAAAAALYRGSLAEIALDIWDYLNEHVQPAVRIADLMSFGVQVVEADDRISEIIQRIRRIGHEGYPVLEHGQVVGLLTLRDADKTLEHGLKDATVRDIMLGGSVILYPEDSVARLEETMVETDWGQIPIVDSHNQLIGIVTRTDLIKHWGQAHPITPADMPRIDPDTARRVLGHANAALIEQIARHAHETHNLLYMVGGVVRDLLLERPNYDIDFVVEGDALEFTTSLCDAYGGRTHLYKPFRTAKWTLDAEVAAALGLPLEAIPDHIDFATARSELYDHPTALPTVYNSGIKLDLRRRDFTINTLAVQLSPQRAMWRILDFYGGLADIGERLIRVLHSLSFVDDPTRILRAVRFSERLRFVIEPRTTELIQTALPMLRRITGERLRNELTLLLNEPAPTRGLLKLEALGALRSIHPAFSIHPVIQEKIEALNGDLPEWSHDRVLLRWYAIMAQVSATSVAQVCRRLLFSQSIADDMQRTAELIQKPDILLQANTKPSQIDAIMTNISVEGLVTAWAYLDHELARQHIRQYYEEWRHVKPITNGYTLKNRGLVQGPEYRIILDRLRQATLDGEVKSLADEEDLLDKLIREVHHDRSG